MHTPNQRGRYAAISFIAVAALSALSLQPIRAQDAPQRSVELRVLLFTRSDIATTSAVKAGLEQALVPYTEVNLDHPLERQPFAKSFLFDGDHANFQAVVLPDEAPAELTEDERAALVEFESKFRIREFVALVADPAKVGLVYSEGWCGPVVDGAVGQVVAQGTDAFSYLKGPIAFDDNDPTFAESTGCIATPQPGFTSVVDVSGGTVLGVFQNQGRQQLVLTVGMNANQLQHKLLFPGILNWLTYGLHLGLQRNYFAMHIDDVLLETGRWGTNGQCENDDGCAVCPNKLLMTPADVTTLVNWQNTNGLKLEIVFNGSGYAEAPACETGSPQIALGNALFANASDLRWISHTYAHKFNGCAPDKNDEPCSTPVTFISKDDFVSDILKNAGFGTDHKLPGFSSAELVTGGHSGLQTWKIDPAGLIPPQLVKPDHPDLPAVLDLAGIKWIASDDSMEHDQRAIGGALTVPRYPTNIAFDVATLDDAVDEYNRAIQAKNPVDDSKMLIEREASLMLAHAISNTPKPHYAHQANLAGGEKAVLYPVMNEFLTQYGKYFAMGALENLSMTQFGQELQRRDAWKRQSANVKAVVRGGVLKVEGASASEAPLTLPATFRVTAPSPEEVQALKEYAGVVNGWAPATSELTVPTSVEYAN